MSAQIKRGFLRFCIFVRVRCTHAAGRECGICLWFSNMRVQWRDGAESLVNAEARSFLTMRRCMEDSDGFVIGVPVRKGSSCKNQDSVCN